MSAGNGGAALKLAPPFYVIRTLDMKKTVRD